MSRNLSKRGNGEGSVFYREKIQRWVGQVTIGIDNNGKNKKHFLWKYQKRSKNKNGKIGKRILNWE